MSERKIFGWFMWDVDSDDGYQEGFFVCGEDNPVAPSNEQEDYGGDHRGHIWDSHPLYK
jgi:hypothetical protein